MKNAVNWFEIPVTNMDRAVACYEALLGERLRRETFGGAVLMASLRSSSIRRGTMWG